MQSIVIKEKIWSKQGVSLADNEIQYAAKKEVVSAIEDCYKTIPGFHKRTLIYTQRCILLIYYDKPRRPLAEDVLQNVVVKILQLQRKWNPGKCKFYDFLKMVIFSYLKNEAKRVSESIDLPERNEEDFETDVRELSVNNNKDKFEADHIFSETYEQLVEKCLLKLEEDKIAAKVFIEVLENSRKNIIIAEKLGLSVREVENAKKRIRNKLSKLLIKS